MNDIPDNGRLGELLWRAGAEESGHRRRALERASRAARFWPEEAADVARSGRALTELRGVGPWVAERILALLEDPRPAQEPDDTRRDYLTFAEVRRILDADPRWESNRHGDLQVHSTDSEAPCHCVTWRSRRASWAAPSSPARTTQRA